MWSHTLAGTQQRERYDIEGERRERKERLEERRKERELRETR